MPTTSAWNKPRWRLAFAALACSGAAGCGASESGAERASAAQSTSAELLAPPPEGKGTQFKLVTTLEAGVEAEHCRFVVGPPEGMLVQRDEVRYTAGSHHALVYDTPYDSVPTVTRNGETLDTSGVFDCSDGATENWEVTKVIAGSQSGLGESTLGFPDGVAVRVRPNAVMLINAHYVNTRNERIDPEVRVNLYTIEESELEQEGDVLFLYNPLIEVRPGESARARMRCPVHEDITLVNVQSHMHRRGVGFAAMLAEHEPFYAHDRWEGVPIERFDGGMPIRAGAQLDYYCDYENSGSHAILQGPRSTDEMCMLIGAYYPGNLATSNCMSSDGLHGAATWVGNGHASCAATFDCIREGSNQEGLGAVTRCMLQADPDVAAEASDLVNCMAETTDALADCSAELEACLAR